TREDHGCKSESLARGAWAPTWRGGCCALDTNVLSTTSMPVRCRHWRETALTAPPASTISRRRSSARRCMRASARAARVRLATSYSRPCATNSAATSKDDRRAMMDATQADPFVFFGATGDLAYKQIFPALQA